MHQLTRTKNLAGSLLRVNLLYYKHKISIITIFSFCPTNNQSGQVPSGADPGY